MFKGKGKGKAKGDGIVKKLVKYTGRKWLAGLIIGGAITLAVTLGLLFLSSVFMTQIAGILGFKVGPQDTVEDPSTECPCGCVLIGVNVRPDGSYGHGTGSLTAGSLESEAVGLMKYFADQGSNEFRPFMMWGQIAIETALGHSGQLADLYESAPASIFETVMNPYNGKGMYGGSNAKTGAINKHGGTPIGPFQIMPAYYDGWSYYLPDEEIQALAGAVPTDITNRNGQVPNPCYLPDVLKAFVPIFSDNVQKYMDKASSHKGWSELSPDAQYYVGYMLECMYYNGGSLVDTHLSHEPTMQFFFAVAKTIDTNPEALYNCQGGPAAWDQAGGVDNKTVPELVAAVGLDSSYVDEYKNYSSSNKANNLRSQWLYGAKALTWGMMNYEKVIGAGPGESKGKFTADAGGSKVETAVTHKPAAGGTSKPVDWTTTAFIGDSLTLGLSANTELGGLGAEINAGTGRGLALDSTGTPPAGAEARVVGDTSGKQTIVFTLGTNSAGNTAESFRSAYNTVLDKVVENNPEATIYIGLLPPIEDGMASSWSSVTNDDIIRCNGVITEEAQSRGYTIIDGYTQLWEDGIQTFTGDGVHLNSDGYNKWWNLIKDTVKFGGGGSGTNPGDPGGGSSGEAAGGTGVQDGAIWNCTCLVPCPYCHCHDDGYIPNGNKPGEGELNTREFPEPAKGVASGLWGTTEELANYIESSSANGIDKDAMRQMLDYVGMAPKAYGTSTWVDYGTRKGGDKFKGPDGLGMVCYHQGSASGSGEPYNAIDYQGGHDLTGSGCGFIALANALSTLEKKWVNPAEVLIAMGTTSERGGYASHVVAASNGAAYSSALAQVAQQAGYTAVWGGDKENGSTIGFSQSKVDDVIDAGGLVVAVLRGLPVSSKADSAHYIVIRDKLSSGNYVICNSLPNRELDTGPNGAVAQEFTWAELDGSKGSGGDQVVYIYPKIGIGAGTSGGIGVATFPPFGKDSNGNPVSNKYTSDIVRPSGGSYHGGIDLIPGNGTGLGAPIYSIADGRVAFSGRATGGNADRGYMVVVEHGVGDQAWCSEYQHMGSDLRVKVGDEIAAGTQVGTMHGSGSTGVTKHTSGPRAGKYDYDIHLHMEVYPMAWSSWTGGSKLWVDPLSVIGGQPTFGDAEPGGANVFGLTTLVTNYNSNPRSGKVINQGTDYGRLVKRFASVPSNVFQR